MLPVISFNYYYGNAMFEKKWLNHIPKEVLERQDLDSSSALKRALNYSVNQEPYLRVFLEDPEVPMHNNDAEQSIRNSFSLSF